MDSVGVKVERMKACRGRLSQFAYWKDREYRLQERTVCNQTSTSGKTSASVEARDEREKQGSTRRVVVALFDCVFEC